MRGSPKLWDGCFEVVFQSFMALYRKIFISFTFPWHFNERISVGSEASPKMLTQLTGWQSIPKNTDDKIVVLEDGGRGSPGSGVEDTSNNNDAPFNFQTDLQPFFPCAAWRRPLPLL